MIQEKSEEFEKEVKISKTLKVQMPPKAEDQSLVAAVDASKVE